MIALGLFATSLGVLLTAQMAAARHEAHAQKVFVASALARELLTRSELDGFPEPGDDSGDFGADFPEYSWKRSVRDAVLDSSLLDSAAALGVDTQQLALAVPGLREVRLTVVWSERDAPQSADLVYYAVQP